MREILGMLLGCALLIFGMIEGTSFAVERIKGHFENVVMEKRQVEYKRIYDQSRSERYAEFAPQIEEKKEFYKIESKKQNDEYGKKISNQKTLYDKKFNKLASSYKEKINESSLNGIKQGRTEILTEHEAMINKKYRKKLSEGDWNSKLMTVKE